MCGGGSTGVWGGGGDSFEGHRTETPRGMYTVGTDTRYHAGTCQTVMATKTKEMVWLESLKNARKTSLVQDGA